MVDYDLRHIHEIPKLCLPEDEVPICRNRIPIFEAERRGLRKGRVEDLEASRANLAKRGELNSRLEVVKNEVALREGASLRVLPGESDRDAFLENRPQRQALGVTPVQLCAQIEPGSPLLELPLQFRVNGEGSRYR